MSERTKSICFVGWHLVREPKSNFNQLVGYRIITFMLCLDALDKKDKYLSFRGNFMSMCHLTRISELDFGRMQLYMCGQFHEILFDR